MCEERRVGFQQGSVSKISSYLTVMTALQWKVLVGENDGTI